MSGGVSGIVQPAPAGWIAPIPAATRRHLARLLIGDAADTEGVAVAHDPAAAARAATEGRIGLVTVAWPGVAHPVWLRAGTGDANDLIAAMRDTAAALQVAFTPRRIVEIGAGAGFRSVALAVAHPGATIASVEPIPARARLHSLNTLPWRQIIGVRAAIAEGTAEFGQSLDGQTGQPRLAPAAGGGIGAISLAALLRHLTWDAVDLLVIDPDACPDLGAASIVPALLLARVVALGGADGAVVDAVRRSLPEATHAVRVSGGYTMFIRRDDTAPAAPARRLYAFDCGGGVVACRRHDVGSEPWAFFPIGDTGFRLHPNVAGAPPAQLVTRHGLAGPRRFETILRLNHEDARPVRFRVTITAAETGGMVREDAVVLEAGVVQQWGFDMPLFFGAADVAFSTEMANAEANPWAWAEFLEPGFV